MTDTTEVVLWTPREYNVVVHHAVNATMDAGTSWAQCDTHLPAEALLSASSLQLSVDGSVGTAGLALFGVCRSSSSCAKHDFASEAVSNTCKHRVHFLGRSGGTGMGFTLWVTCFKGKVIAASTLE